MLSKSILTSIILCLSSSIILAGKTEDFFVKLAKGQLVPLESSYSSGWMMTTKDGKKIIRSKLNRQADVIAEHGIQAVPECIKRLDDKEMYIRYIAVKSLRKITKKNPTWYYFGTPGQKRNGNETWSNDAKKIWKQWYKDELKGAILLK